MRLVLKSLYKAVTAMLTIAMAAMMFMPASDDEAFALGRDNTRFNLVQMRLANVMMTVAPDFVVARYAEATGMPPDMIRYMLTQKANGEGIVPDRDDFYAERDTGVPVDQPTFSSRRTEAGGALFATPD